MRNEDELALHYQRHADLLKTQKKIYGYEQSKGRVMKPALSEKKIKEYVYDFLNNMELYPHEIEEYKEMNFDSVSNDLNDVKIHFEGKIASYREKEISLNVFYIYTVIGTITVYDSEDNLLSTIPFEDEFDFEIIVDEMSYYGLKESDF